MSKKYIFLVSEPFSDTFILAVVVVLRKQQVLYFDSGKEHLEKLVLS